MMRDSYVGPRCMKLKFAVLDVNAMNQGCQQQPSAGETLQLGFDLFPPASKATLSSSAATVTVTSSSLPKSSSSTSAPSASGQSGTVFTATVTALASKSNNHGVKVGVGVGIGVACIIAIVAGAIFLLMRRRSSQKFKAELEEDTRAQWEAEYRVRAAAENGPQRAELGAAAVDYVAEADDGWPQNIPMLESPEDTRTSSSPGGFQHSDHEPFSDSSDSNLQFPGTLNSQGLAKYIGRPPMPEKDSRSDSPRPQH